ncbi:unnamed protein product [Ilex paraguariensis]|uniref:Pentatricopeptide repeat-containing protein n=1 Tax=Ilex paraguariensis TaxID=185542 RepID=A0ABC8U828_9AQUA
MSSSALPPILPLPLSSSTTSLPTQSRTHQHSQLLSIPNSPSQTQQWGYEDSNHHTSSNSPPKVRTIRYRLSQLCQQGQPHLARQLFDTIPRPTTVLWNTIIIGFVCNSMPGEAISVYARMKSSSPDTKCDYYTYSAALKACAETKQLKIGKAVHCHILRSHLYPSRIVCNSLLNMYTTCLSSVDSELDITRHDLVQKIFHTMHRRNVVAWNTMISWYTKTHRFVEAIRHFMMMVKLGIKPTVISFVNVFPGASGSGDIDIANILYGLLIKMGSDYVDDLFAVSSSIFMYAELACLDLARKVFDHSLERNTEVWNTMIGAYVQNNRPIEALDLFLEALESQDDVLLDDVTYLSVLTAASQLQQLDFAQVLHAYIIKGSFVLNIIVVNAIIAMYSRCNCIDKSFKVFSGMQERDVVSWNTMVSALVQNGFDDEGLMLVYEMQKQGFAIDSVSLTSLLSAASNLRNKDIGKQAHAYLLRNSIQLEGMECYLIDMYAKCGLIKAAQTLFEINCTNNRDQATWNAMIAGNTQNGLIEQAFIIFRQMIEENMTPNAVTLASILPACNQMGCMALGKQLHGFAIRNNLDQNVFVGSALVDMIWSTWDGEKALMLFYSMGEFGIKPDAITFVAVLAACSCTGLVDEGLQVYESMEEKYGIRLLSEHYCCVVDMLGRAGRLVEAYEFVRDLGHRGNVLGIWGSLLAACRIHGEFELGKIVADKMLEMDWGDSMAGYHVLLSNIYAEEGNWDNVNRVRKEMREKGLAKEVGCSWIDIAGHMNCFVSKDRKHPKYDELCEMLKELDINMKEAGYRPCFGSQVGLISESDEWS